MKKLILYTLIIISLFFVFNYLTTFKTKKKSVLNLHRFEELVFSINEKNYQNIINEFEVDHPVFSEFFSNKILNQKDIYTKNYKQEIFSFVNHSDMREAYDSVSVFFQDLNQIKYEIDLAFTNIYKYFPNYSLPEVYTFFGGFKYGVIFYDDVVGIGLENFLGKNSKFYSLLGEPKYLREYKNPDYITSNVVEVWCNNYFLKNNQSDFLSKLIYYGKVMFFVKDILPKKKDNNNLRFSKKQMDWLLDNESKIWSFIIENKLLYAQRERDYRSFFYYSPFVKGMPKEAPARLGYFIGYKIIDSYMKNNRVSISELMLENDYSKILNKSKYKPRK